MKKLPKSLTTVTPLSKAIALALFLILPLAAFGAGEQYGRAEGILATYSQTASITPSPHIAPPESEKAQYGIFVGKIPCADCSALMETITIRPDGTFTQSDVYVGKSTTPIVTTGGWKIHQGDAVDPHALVYQLIANGQIQNYLLSGDTLTLLDKSLRRIDSPFNESLKKQ